MKAIQVGSKARMAGFVFYLETRLKIREIRTTKKRSIKRSVKRRGPTWLPFVENPRRFRRLTESNPY